MYIVEVSIRCAKATLTDREVWNLVNYVLAESVKEGLNPPDHLRVVVLDGTAFKRYTEKEGVVADSGFCKAFPPLIVVRGDITADNLAFILVKLARAIVVLNTYGAVNMDECDNWAREHFMRALSYMVR